VTNYYVYYRIDAGHVDSLEFEIKRLFDKIQEQFGVSGRWMRRRDDAATFMEVYEGVKDEQAFESVLAREGASLKLERKVERFVDA
jgi:uncharacterized protein DUF4936